LDRLDQLARGENIQIDKCIPKKGATAEIVDEVSLYAFRPTDVTCFHMSETNSYQYIDNSKEMDATKVSRMLRFQEYISRNK
jgi:hypothetical protein